MNKPKYTIGDAFLIERKVTNEGCLFVGKFNYYILAITVQATIRGYAYQYGLGRTFPQADVTGSVTRWDYESVLDTFEKTEGYFGKT